MRIVFMGSPDFAVPVLAALLAAGHTVPAVYSQPPRPAGRGQRERPCPVHAFAAARGLPVRTPRSLRDPEAQRDFAALDADAAVVAAYGLILPPPVLAAPRHGCLNVHASLLPRWRGAAPIQRAIEAGDSVTGVTIMQMEAGLDTGPMLLSDSVPIGPAATAADLHDALAALGARLIVAALDRLAEGGLTPVSQPDEGVTYARKLTAEDGRLDWTRSAVDLARLIRAFTPWPGAWFTLDGQRIKALAAEPATGAGVPGTVLDDRLTVACGEGALRLVSVQREGRQAMAAEAFLRGRPVAPGTRLG